MEHRASGSGGAIDDSENIAHQLSVYKHRKKQAANDAQLLMNRIALLQKEEERAKKKIDATKDRANEILSMRHEHGRRLQSYVDSANEEKGLKEKLKIRNKESEMEGRRNRAALSEQILMKRREDAAEVNTEKKILTKLMLREQEKEIRIKQQKKEKVKRMEEEAKLKREQEKRDQERRLRESYLKKAKAEEDDARKAEKLVKALEKKEKEWMNKLSNAQQLQEMAFEHLESALLKDSLVSVSSNTPLHNHSSPGKRK